MMRRQPRTLRRKEPRPIRSQGRDSWLLEILAKTRFLTTSQVARLAFGGSRSAANKRLRKLLDAGLVRAWVRNLAQDTVYALDRAGAKIVARDQGEAAATPSVPRGLDGNLEHLLAINDVRISLAMGLEGVAGEIVWWRSDWELRASVRERVVPDALFAIRWDGIREQPFALEIDNRTRSSRAFVKKILAYGGVEVRGRGLFGVSGFITLVVGRDPRWIERYREAVAHARLGDGVWFTTLDALNATPHAEIWEGVQGGERASLRDLDCRPYGKEGWTPESAEETRT